MPESIPPAPRSELGFGLKGGIMSRPLPGSVSRFIGIAESKIVRTSVKIGTVTGTKAIIVDVCNKNEIDRIGTKVEYQFSIRKFIRKFVRRRLTRGSFISRDSSSRFGCTSD